MAETDFVRSHQWAEKAGLDVIACISPDDPQESDESEAARGIISFADHVRLNTNWQLGYGKLIDRRFARKSRRKMCCTVDHF